MKTKFGIWALALLLCGSIAGDARADHEWGPPYHWARTVTDMPLMVVDSVTPSWQSELDTSIVEWSKTDVLHLVDGGDDDGKGTRKKCKSVAGQMRVCNAAYGYNGWLGMASINIDSNYHITRGTAKVNDSYSSYWELEGEKNHVMCQEIGHVFGLGHTSTNGSSQGTCMDYSSHLDSQWPNAHDLEQLVAIYGHPDSYNTYDDGSVEVATDDPKVCPPRNKNCNGSRGPEIPPMGVRVHKGRHHEIWVARGRAGSLWIHHVRLVPEEYR